MEQAVDFLKAHGYLLLFGFVLAEQIGLPVPSVPVLLAAGALSAAGHLSLTTAIAVAMAATMLSDVIWYQLGRSRGQGVLKLLCRVALEPDSCVRKTTDAFERYGLYALVFSKFVPGLNTAAPPLAGISRMPMWRFLGSDAVGTALWVGSFVGLGYYFSGRLEFVVVMFANFGYWVLSATLGGLAVWLGWKYLQRWRFLQMLKVARIAPEELRRRLEANEDLVVVDLRTRQEAERESVRLPGALRLDPKELEARHEVIPRDREIVLYCT
ncbi:MAG: VTT domain-containing protein [Bryobacteraceae bacterium]